LDGYRLWFQIMFSAAIASIMVGGTYKLVTIFVVILFAAFMVLPYLRSIYLPSSTLLLRVKARNRPLFSQKEILTSNLVDGLFATGLILLVCAGLLRRQELALIGVLPLLICIPMTGLLEPGAAKRKGLLYFAILLILLAFSGLASTLLGKAVIAPILVAALALASLIFVFQYKLSGLLVARPLSLLSLPH
jgi:hypothetical protein